MLLAELNVRHTRRHMPTRRVALGDTYLPTEWHRRTERCCSARWSPSSSATSTRSSASCVPRLLARCPRGALRAAHRAAVPAPDRHARSRPVAAPDPRRDVADGSSAGRPRARPPRSWRPAGHRHDAGRGGAATVGPVGRAASDRSRAPSADAARAPDRAAPPRGRARPADVHARCAGPRRRGRRPLARHPGRPAVGDGGARPARRHGRRATRRARSVPSAGAAGPSGPRCRQRHGGRAARRAARGARAPARLRRVGRGGAHRLRLCALGAARRAARARPPAGGLPERG